MKNIRNILSTTSNNDFINERERQMQLLKMENNEQEQDFVLNHITILPELATFIHPLTDEESDFLRQSLIEEGCRDAIILWQRPNDYVIVDGHNRYNICSTNSIPFKYILMNFPDIEKVKEWMIVNQFSKRNLTDERKAYYRGLLYNRMKTDKKKNLKQYKEENPIGQFDQSEEKNSKIEQIIKNERVDRKTLQRDEKFFQGIEKIKEKDEDLAQSILKGDTKITKQKVMEYATTNDSSLEELFIQTKKEVKKISYLNESLMQEIEELRKKINRLEYNLDEVAPMMYFNILKNDLSLYQIVKKTDSEGESVYSVLKAELRNNDREILWSEVVAFKSYKQAVALYRELQKEVKNITLTHKI